MSFKLDKIEDAIEDIKAGKVVIVDDVITAGTAVREVLTTIAQNNAEPAAIIIGLNRQERGKSNKSAIDELQDETGVPVISIIELSHIMKFLENKGDEATLQRVAEYRQKYGST